MKNDLIKMWMMRENVLNHCLKESQRYIEEIETVERGRGFEVKFLGYQIFCCFYRIFPAIFLFYLA